MVSTQHIVLLGGGHSHVEVLRRFGLASELSAEITLISPHRFAPYSGMLPGLVAGHYRWEECHIDLEALCRHAKADLRLTSAREIDPNRRQVSCVEGPEQDYDVLSVDVGSTPAIDSIPGASETGILVKPVDRFLTSIDSLSGRIALGQARRIVIVGAGAAGVEICLALHYRLAQSRPELHLVSSTNTILPGHNGIVRSLMTARLRSASVRTHLGKTVLRAHARRLEFSDESMLEFDEIIWATGACAPRWLRGSGLTLTEEGFILVNDHLQSVSHSNVFAAGDVATMRDHATPKSGVYAVRQGPPLAENLLRVIAAQPLMRYVPQLRALALISTGGRHAIASWGPLAWAGDWVWRRKDSIDRRFISKYRVP